MGVNTYLQTPVSTGKLVVVVDICCCGRHMKPKPLIEEAHELLFKVGHAEGRDPGS